MNCMDHAIQNANFSETGFSYAMSLISGKHKMVILYCLMEYEPVRFNEMKRYLGAITDKTLSSNLKELESDHLILRKEYPQISRVSIRQCAAKLWRLSGRSGGKRHMDENPCAASLFACFKHNGLISTFPL